MLIGVAAACGAGAGPASAQERRVALVIGNQQYRQGGPVAAVGGNVDAMVSALRRAGFAVTAADNLDRRAMQAEVSRFRDALGQADLGFLYYSGLALGIGEREYLLPVDAALAAEGDAGSEALGLDDLIGQVQQAGKRAILVLDPAATNPFADRLARLPGAVAKAALGLPPDAERLFVVYAHRPDVAPVPARGGGPDAFTAALAGEMVKPGVPFRDSLAEVARAVVARTGGRQYPWLQDRIGGDLVLVPGAPPQIVAAKPAQKPEAPRPDLAKSEPARPEGGRPEIAARVVPEPPPTPPAPPPGLSPGTYAVMRAGTLFAQPTIGARGLRSLEAGTVVTVVEAVQGSNWLRVRERSGQEGFVTAGILAGSWNDTDPSPPIALVPRTPVEREPLAGDAGRGMGLPSGASDPSDGAGRSRSQGNGPQGSGSQEAGGEAIRAEQQAYRAQREARTVAEQARAGTSQQLWSYGFPNGDVYQGASVVLPDRMPGGRPSRQGFGIYRFAGGQVYEGEWLDDTMSGFGVLSFANGDRYAGTFRNGRPDGHGIYRYADGSRRGGIWRGTERVGD